MGLLKCVGMAVGAALVVSACASKTEKASCERRDWYELGRRDGSQGLPLDRMIEYKKECGEQFNSSGETVYMNGRNAGLVEFCLPENAYELGLMGMSYLFVCPSTMETDFLASFRKGQQARVLQL